MSLVTPLLNLFALAQSSSSLISHRASNVNADISFCCGIAESKKIADENDWNEVLKKAGNALFAAKGKMKISLSMMKILILAKAIKILTAEFRLWKFARQLR